MFDKDVDNSEDVGHDDPLEGGEAEFVEDVNGSIDDSLNSDDEGETDEEMDDEKILTGDTNHLRNYANLAEELKGFVTESSEVVWKDNCKNGVVFVKDDAAASGDLRQRILLDKQQVE